MTNIFFIFKYFESNDKYKWFMNINLKINCVWIMFLNEITIVITTYFSEEKLIRCLKSINNKCKVIVIENSKDN